MIRRSPLMLAASLAVVAALSATPLPAVAKEKKAESAEAAKPKLSKPFTPAYSAAQKAIEAGDAAAIKPALEAAKAAVATEDDRYVAGTLYIQASSKLKDTSLQAEGLNLVLASTFTPPAQRRQYSFFAGLADYQAGNAQAALPKLTAAYDGGYRENDIEVVIAEAYGKAGDAAQSTAWMEKAIAAKTAAGGAVPEAWLKRQVAVAYNAKNYPTALSSMSKLTEAYPTQANWRDMLKIYRESVKLDNGDNLDVLRLMRAAGALRGQADYAEYAEMADGRLLPGEVAAVLREGEAAGQLGGSAFLKDEMTAAADRTAADKAALPTREATARSAPEARIALATADGYLGHGSYAKAIEFYDVAIQKGGALAERAKLRKGIALALSGDKAAAEQSLAAVQGGSKQQIASYWRLWLQKGSSAS